MEMTDKTAAPDGTGLIGLDPWLEPYRDALRKRYDGFRRKLAEIEAAVGSLEAMSRGHEYFGLTRGEQAGQPGVWYREWAPGAQALFLTGDFNDWNRRRQPLVCDGFGVWSIFLPDAEYAHSLVHGSRVKVHVVSERHTLDRIPAYIRRVVQAEDSPDFSGQYWAPPPYAWQHPVPAPGSLRIYEAHVGMAQEKEGIGSFREFSQTILPRIAAQGYNVLQLMGIMQHPYYASFGYQVSNFFAVSSFFGTPEDLKELIDTAHGLGLAVFLDLIHNHTVKNLHEGLNEFDGTNYQYFHAGGRGEHLAWGSKLFDYGKFEVLRFLLSNVRYWLEEFHFDGLRFDGVTSTIYLDHGLHRDFGDYDDYFEEYNLDADAIVYLQLANHLAHRVKPGVITIAEDVSGLPGMARPVDDGGLGFDYRLAMGVPDNWIRLLKEVRDEDWPMEGLFQMLAYRRPGEKHIAYCESHDQALVGDQTIAFRLMGSAMYTDMAISNENHLIDRGMALHKLIRLVTYAFGGEAWLNFMGNEFGHPEWIDFPREGNGFSYFYARRQWSLADNGLLRYQFLNNFDQAMHALDRDYDLLAGQTEDRRTDSGDTAEPAIEILAVHEHNKLLCCWRGKLVFLFNFHPDRSFTEYRVGIPEPSDYTIVLSSDAGEFGGFDRVKVSQLYPLQDEPWDERLQSIQVYLPARSVQVLAPRA